MIVNLSEIMSVKGNVVKVQAPIELESFCMEGIEYPFADKSDVNLTITNLEDVKNWFELKFEKDLDFNQDSEERIKELDETNYITEYNLDVDLLIYDEILIDFPMKVLCDENCKGFCKVCGTSLNVRNCDCQNAGSDPRMSIIRDIFNNFKEV